METSNDRARRWRRGAWVSAVISAGLIGCVAAAGYFDRDPVRAYPVTGSPTTGRRGDIAAVNFSGDMGLRFLLGATTSNGLAAQGIPVVGITTPALFRTHRTRAAIDAIVVDAIRTTLARTGARRIVVIGQSYGADIVQTGLAALPAALRPRVAAIILILPGETVFFRADPTGLEYRGRPDGLGTATANTLRWAPLTCIQGVEETDSLCPRLRVPGASVIAMPGDHDIDHDGDGLLAHVLAAIRRAAPRVATIGKNYANNS